MEIHIIVPPIDVNLISRTTAEPTLTAILNTLQALGAKIDALSTSQLSQGDQDSLKGVLDRMSSETAKLDTLPKPPGS